MSGRSVLLLVAGAVVGFVAGAATLSVVGAGADEPQRIARLERELAVERAGRASDRAARDNSEELLHERDRELVLLRGVTSGGASPVASSSNAPAPGGSSSPENKTPTAPATSGSSHGTTNEGPDATPARPKDDAAARAERLRTIAPEIEAAIAAKDVKKMVALLEELAKLGKEAWPHVVKLSVAAAHAAPAHPEAGMDLFRALSGFGDLYGDAIGDDLGRYPLEFRHLAVGYFPYTGTGSRSDLLAKRLATETDESVGQAMANVIAFGKDATRTPLLAAALTTQTRPAIRLRILAGLAELPGEASLAALEQASRQDPDPEVRRAADYAVRSRSANVVGYFITYLAPASPLAGLGLREGDVVTTIRGTAILSLQDLYKVYAAVAAKFEPVPIVVSRGGATFPATIETMEILGQLFGSGRFVRPDEH